MSDKRLDFLLVDDGYVSGREKAKELIKSGVVFVNGVKCSKASFSVKDSDKVEVMENSISKYVGRGALKLDHALSEFGIDLKGKTCIDIGASTGGFTDCMLVNGACRVFAVDVGHDQLAEKLRDDKRVVSMENTDIRDIDVEAIDGGADFASVDVSFISLKHVLDKVNEVLKEGGESVMLIKPQFEAGKSFISKKGIVKDRKVHERVLIEVYGFARQAGFSICGLCGSPVKGGKGNIEYLMYAEKADAPSDIFDFAEIVSETFRKLN